MQTEVAGNVTLAQQPFARADVIGKIVQETQRLIKNQLPIIQRSMQLYLANRETEFILFRPIKVCFTSIIVTKLGHYERYVFLSSHVIL
jgi:hypothetical protein